jgi:hypothetical protein
MNELIQCPKLTDQLTVEAWVRGDDGTGGEAMQALVSKWSPPSSFDRFDAFDASATDGLNSTGYFGAAFDGRYVYFSPEQHESLDTHAVVSRCDTLGNNGSFSLRYCDYGHNGGLNAAVPGPSFLVNTESGVRSLAAHKVLPAGRHHLKGIYDGKRIQLWLDGKLAAERAALGRIVNNDLPVTLGRIQDGLGRFRGTIESAHVRANA